LIGLALGLYYTWVAEPVQFTDTYPPLMYEPYRRDWIRMAALAHGYEGNLARSRWRLQDLAGDMVREELARTLDMAVATGRSVPVLRNLARLAQAYGVESVAVDIYTGGGVGPVDPTPLPSPTPSPTHTPTPVPPTRTPTPIPPTPTEPPTPIPPSPTPVPPPYVLLDEERSCLPTPNIAVTVTRAVSVTVGGRERLEIQGVSGVEVWILWPEGADRAITGLRPELSPGYADFVVEPNTTYNLYLEQPTGAPLAALEVEPCAAGEEEAWYSWQVTVRETEPESGNTPTPTPTQEPP
jgi:hypothetical protein